MDSQLSVEDYKFARKMARLFAWKFSFTRLDFDDFAQVASIAMWQALKNFDPDKGVRSTYLYHRAYGAMQDLLRDEDWLSRSDRKNIDGGEEQVMWAPDDDVDPYDPLELLHRKQISDTISRALEKLPTTMKYIAISRLEGKMSKDIAAELGVTLSAVSQQWKIAQRLLQDAFDRSK